MLNNKAMENGYVVLPIETYNELLNAQKVADKFLMLKTSYDKDSVEAVFDQETLYKAAVERFNNSPLNDGMYELQPFDKFYAMSVNIAKLVKPAAEGEES